MPNNVEIVLSARDAGTVRAWQIQRDNIAKYEASLGKVDAAQGRNAASAKQWETAIAGTIAQYATGFFSIQKAIQAAQEALAAFQEANRQAAKESEDAAKKQEYGRKRVQVQAGIGPLAAKDVQKDLRKIAEETATPNEDVTDIATMLLSSGADVKTASGGGTKEIAKFLKAQALKGNEMNSQEFTDSITAFLAGQGKELNEENIVKLVQQLQSKGIKATKFKIPDLKYWAKEAQGLTQMGMDQEEILSVAASTSGAVPAEHASRQVREIMKNLSVASSRPDRVKVLKQMGIKPQDVDGVDETPDQMITRIMEGLERLKPGERQGALDKLVEGANIGEFYAMARGMGKKNEIKAGLSDTKEYEQDVKTMTTGRGAAETRLQNQIENQDADRGGYADLHRKAYEAEMKERKYSQYHINRRLGQYDWSIGQGFDPEQAMTTGTNIFDTIGGDAVERQRVAQATRRRFEKAVGGKGEADNVRREAGVEKPRYALEEKPVDEANRKRDELRAELANNRAAKKYKITGTGRGKDLETATKVAENRESAAREKGDDAEASDLKQAVDTLKQLVELEKSRQRVPAKEPSSPAAPAAATQVSLTSQVFVNNPGNSAPVNPVPASRIGRGNRS